MNIADYYIIPTFAEALAIVENSKGFSHSVQEVDGKEVHSFKYNISYQGMWDDLSDGKINMRGITFVDGVCVALPCPKFFNIGENIHVQDVSILGFMTATEKVDGSLISFFKVGDKLELKTMKSVYSDTAVEAREYSNTRKDITDFAMDCINHSLSPMFEYVSDTDQGRIVIDYGKKDLVFLGARDMATGTIYNDLLNFPLDIPFSISTAKTFKNNDEVSDYLKLEGIEGVVVTLKDGTMVKLKTDWYCKIHRILDLFSTKNILENIVTDNLDDIRSALVQHNMAEQIEAVDKVEKEFYKHYNVWTNLAEFEYRERKHEGATKKDIALTLMKENRVLASLVFALYDGKDISSNVKEIVRKELLPKDLSDF